MRDHREYVLIPSERHRDPVSLVKIHQRLPDLSREAFQQRLLGEHADLVMSRTSTHRYVRRYAQLHNIGSTQADPEGSGPFGSFRDRPTWLEEPPTASN
jgi:hypothetical protein